MSVGSRCSLFVCLFGDLFFLTTCNICRNKFCNHWSKKIIVQQNKLDCFISHCVWRLTTRLEQCQMLYYNPPFKISQFEQISVSHLTLYDKLNVLENIWIVWTCSLNLWFLGIRFISRAIAKYMHSLCTCMVYDKAEIDLKF